MSTAKKSSTKWYIHTIIAIAIMVLFRFIPAPAPMTQLGITVVGIFLGAIYGWCTTNMIWPSILALILFGLTGQMQISTTWGSLMNNPTIGVCFWLMLSVGLLKDTGLIQYIANWSITRKFTQGKPWVFITIVYLAALVCAMCLSEVAVTLAFWSLVWSICDEVGYARGSKTGAWMTFTVGILVGCGGWMLPFKMAVFTNFGFLAAGSNGAYDGSFDYAAWTAFTCSVVAVLLIVYMMISKFIIRVDLSKLGSFVPDETKVVKMTKKQKISLALFVILFILLMAPSFLPKGAAITALVNNFGTVGIGMAIIGITCWIRVDGEPLLKFEDIVYSNVIWNIILMFGTALLLCQCINSEAAGVSAWLNSIFTPLFDDVSPYVFLICYFLIASVVTNFINNAVVGAVMIPVSFSLSVALGLNPVAVCACIILFADFGIFLPSASPTGALIHNSQGWIPRNVLFKYCFLGVALFVLCSFFVGWPLANALFPFSM